MMLGRYALTIPALLLAGRLAIQGRSPSTAGTLPTDSILVRRAARRHGPGSRRLEFLPALTLGPIAEHVLRFSR